MVLLQATMIVFTSTSASIVFLSFGNLPYNYAAAVFVIGIVFTMLGQVRSSAGLKQLL